MASPIPIDQRTREAYGEPRWTEQKNGVRNVEIKGRVKGATRQIAGNTAKAAGVGMQAVGKGAKRVGKTTTKVGARLTATGIGAIVGVPLMAVGGAATVGGAGMDVAGKQVSRAGRRATQKNRSVIGQRNLIKGFSIHARALMTGSFYTLPIAVCWFLELGCYILALAVDAVMDTEIKQDDGIFVQVWKVFSSGIQAGFNAVSSVLSDITGGAIDLQAIISSIHPGNFFALFYIATLGFCIMTMISVWFVYEIGGAKPLSGKGEGAKRSAFLLALCLYCLPIVHLFPWFLVWSYAIQRNDK